MGCSQSSAIGTLEGRTDTTSNPRRSDPKFVPPRPGQLYVRVSNWWNFVARRRQHGTRTWRCSESDSCHVTRCFQAHNHAAIDAHGSRGGRLPCHRRSGYKRFNKQAALRASWPCFVAQPEEHKKSSEDASKDADELANWKGLRRPTSIDEAGSLLVRQLRLQDRRCEDQAGEKHRW